MDFSKIDIHLAITFAVLVAEIVLIWICRVQLKKPADPLKPRMIPYGAIMIFASLGILVTVAHSISLITGEQVKARTSNKLMGQPPR